MILKYMTLCLLLIFQAGKISGQSFNTEFGKNRVQYNDDFTYWSQYESQNFTVYWYGKSKNIAINVIQMAEKNHEVIRRNLEHRTNDKIEILVYTDLADLKQSNIGNEDVFLSKSKATKVVGNKILLYFDGSHQNLEHSIRRGIAEVYLNSMLYGNNLQEIIQNAVSLRLPGWYADGFVAYAGSNWNSLVQDELRDIVDRKKYKYSFKKLAKKYPQIAGHSMWYFIKQEYGRSAILNILYQTKISRDLNKSFEYVLNVDMKTLYKQWEEYYKNLYDGENGKFGKFVGDELKLKNKKYTPFSLFSLSPNGKEMIYALNEIGSIKLYLYQIDSKKNKLIFKSGSRDRFQQTDYDYPQVCWAEDGSEFTFAYEKKDRIYLRKMFRNGDKFIDQILPEDIHHIYSIGHIKDNYYFINGIINGFADLVFYDAKSRSLINITNDYYNDLDAKIATLDGVKGIVFSSNRIQENIVPNELDTILPLDHFDSYFYELPEMKDRMLAKDFSKIVLKLTSTSTYSERYPNIENNQLYFLHDESGIINTYRQDLNTRRTTALTNHPRNIIRHDMQAGQYVYSVNHEGKYKSFLNQTASLNETQVFESYNKAKVADTTNIEIEDKIQLGFIPEGLKFQSEFSDGLLLSDVQDDRLISPIVKFENEEEELKRSRIIPINDVLITASGRKFRLTKTVGKLDNDVLFEGMEIAEGQQENVSQLPMGYLGTVNFKDLFEDFNIKAGVRIASNFSGAEYFFTATDQRKMLDRSFTLYHRTFREKLLDDAIPPTVSKKEILMGMYKLKYPFSTYSSLRGTGYLRFDKQLYKSTESRSLNTGPVNQKRLGVRGEYVYDNSFEKSINILHGTRMKFYVEGMNEFNFELGGGNTKFDLSKSITTMVGLDARHYVPVLTHSVLALRVTSAISFGSKENLYYLGGINNGLFQSFEQAIPISQQEFAFKTNVPNLRGFGNNIRNGSRYGLFNSEIRIPFLRYLLGSEGGSSFFRNLQIVGFVDAGLAWYGSSPYSTKNPLNTISIDDPLIDLEIQYFRDPLVYGFGYGVRSNIFGYQLKVDLGYGVETNKIFKPKIYFGIGKDF
jgi:hypothetical protein